jgi:hypothetical protein
MAIDKFGTTNYVQDMEDLAIYRMQNPPANPVVPQNNDNTDEAASKPKSDSFTPVNNQVLATKTTPPVQFLKSNLEIQIKDKDGFANFGKADLRATVSGDISITKEMILNQLGNMKDGPDKRFNKPRFDAERQQFVISGTGINALLNTFDIPFEIRLGIKDGNLAFLVDSFITRGSVYSDLKEMMLDAGIETYEKDKTLFIKPTVGQTIDLPYTKDKSQIGRIEWIDTNSENTKTSIDKSGTIHVRLNNVQMIASSDISKINKKVEKPDVASIKFDFTLDDKLQPDATFSDGKLDANVSQADIEKYVGKDNMAFMKETFGTALSVSLTGIGGHLAMTEKGTDLTVAGNVAAKATDTDATISTGLKVQLKDDKPVIEANNLDADLVGDQKIKAEHVGFDASKEGITVDAKGVDANVHIPEASIKAQGDGIFTSNKEGLSGSFTGKTDGSLKKDGVDIKFNTAGNHTVSTAGNKLDIVIDKAKVDGGYDSTVRGLSNDKVVGRDEDGLAASKEKQQFNVEIKNVEANTNIKTSIANISSLVSGGGIKAEIGNDIHISSDAKLTATASGNQLNGNIEVQGVDVNIKEDGSASVQVNNTKAQGNFRTDNKKISAGGKISGDINVNVDNKGAVEVKTQKGNIDAKFKLDNGANTKINVTAKGKDASVKVDPQSNISVKLENVDAITDIKANKVKVKAHTKGESVSIDAIGDDVNISTKNTTSQADFKLKELLTVKGKTGDVNVKIHETPDSEDIKIDINKPDVKGTIKNANGNLNIDMGTKADNVKIHVDVAENVTVATKNATTNAHLNLSDKVKHNSKIDLTADSKDFNVDVIGDDVNIKIKDSKFTGKITPKEEIKVGAQATTRSDINIKITDKPEYTDVDISTKSSVKGDVSLAGKLNSNFDNKDGFNLFIKDSPETTHVVTGINGINLDGSFNAGPVNLGVKGSGNFSLDILDKPLTSDVNIGYDGKLGGIANVKSQDQGRIPTTEPDMANGNYSIDGKVKVSVVDDDVNINVKGSLDADVDSPKYGMGAKVNATGTDDQPIQATINIKNDPIVNASLAKGGYIQLKDIDKLKIEDPTVTMILTKLKAKSANISYQELQVKNNADTLSVNIQASGINTDFGGVEASLTLKKDGTTVQVDKGVMIMEPNINLYNLIVEELTKKYKIKIEGKPELKNGTLKVTGEIKSQKGVVQIADFNIKANVVNNELVLDLDKATVLKVISANTVNTVINQVLNHTDIDHLKIDKKGVTIKLADIFKDLSLTEGVNFTGLNMIDNKIKVGFVYNSIDKEIASYAKKKDIEGLSQYIKKMDYKNVSGEALSTAYSTFADAKDIGKSSNFIASLVNMYSNNPDISKNEFDRGLTWISKNYGVKRTNIQDNITMEFTKLIELKTAKGDNLIKALPTGVVRNFANNLDQTISQGAGMSIIFPDERSTANYMRKLKGIPANNAQF